ncbi:hypothetical protein [Planktothrix agardhii]|jgi:hypothetical protein|uniref:hypothetical protein n=1 Tax=Planktothrix agardhii TaxID=1160 RepID=UPI001D0B6133|nr:hypothetical protein [Planktothrix agardhii]MCB8784870.1 hypothetical protein [Planktothrix agardhii 1025]MCF3611033.1 hypothetical protein [Planktothrix agardhii 1027]MCF3644686.1 hypothetical protein [Planktothrix agardhii 1026]MCF3647295.1 hypothetical protein [Planktothrix agardhii 1026]CAD5932820.1 hypothetical protein NO2A_01854 [Planktothrix agardhii]
MNFPAMLDFAIGLFFIYLILSLLVSGLQELIATILEWRAKQLKEAIKILLGDNEANDPSAIQAKKIADDLWNNPLIQSLNQRKIRRSSVGPSYISSKMFGAALLEVLKTNYDLDISGTMDKIVESIHTNQKLDKKVKARIYSIALIAQSKSCKAEQETKLLEREIQIWFDESMERASGVYNRNVKGFAFLIGLIVVPLINADTFHIVERLNKDAAWRSNINQVATNIITQNKDRQKCLKEARELEDSMRRLAELNKCFEDINTGLDNITMPLGWDTSNFPTSTMEQFTKQANVRYPNKWEHWVVGIIKVIFGWLLSAAAIAMGAPFWFELLGKFINVRNAGQVPESTSKDKPS